MNIISFLRAPLRTITLVVLGALVAFAALMPTHTAHAQGNTPLSRFPSFNGTIYTVAIWKGTIYVGGDFTSATDAAENGGAISVRNRLAAIDATTGGLLPWNPNANNEVYAIQVNGNATGGTTVYVGGQFTSIGGVARNRLAAIGATMGEPMYGIPTFWNPNADFIVNILVVRGTTVYVGGQFTSIGGVARNRLAAIDASTGAVAAWNPDANGSVNVIETMGNTVYAGGAFTTIGGVARNRLAAIDATTGAPTAWNPNANNSVYTIAVSGNTVYTGGAFTTIGGIVRNRLAAIDAITGAPTPWNPNANGGVGFITLSGNNVYAGGVFNTLGGVARNCLAAIDVITGAPTSWNPNANGVVNTIALSGNNVYAGGNFTTIGGNPRARFAAFPLSTAIYSGTDFPESVSNNGSITTTQQITLTNVTWAPAGAFSSGVHFTALGVPAGLTMTINRISNTVAEISFTGNAAAHAAANSTAAITLNFTNAALTGGSAADVGGLNGQALSISFNDLGVDVQNNTPLSRFPTFNGAINTIAVWKDTIYVGGSFTSATDATENGSVISVRNCLAAIDAKTGRILPWNPNANALVNDIHVSGNATGVTTVYAGGNFTTIGGVARNYLAAIDATTGAPTAWNPNPNSVVGSIGVRGKTVYAGGFFTIIGGVARNRIAAIDATTGAPTAWNPNANGAVYTMAVSGNIVYASGDFTTIGGVARNRIAAIDATTGVPTAWNPNANGAVYTMAVSGNIVYASGDFTNIGGVARNRIAAIDATTGVPMAWNPNANGAIYTMAASGNIVYVGGGFTTIGGVARNRLAAIHATTGTAITLDPNANGIANTIALSGNNVYAGGSFTTIGGNPRAYFAAFGPASTAIYSGTDFPEAVANDGSVTTAQQITLTNATWAAGAFIPGVHFTAVGVPAGLTMTINRISNTVAEISFTGNAAAHAAANSTAAITLNFTNAALIGGSAADVGGLNGQALSISFNDPAVMMAAPRGNAETVHAVQQASELRSVESSEVIVYPNPAEAEFTVSAVLSESTVVEVTLRDAIGKQVWRDVQQAQVGEYRRTINVRGLAPGMYVLELNDGQRILRRTLLRR